MKGNQPGLEADMQQLYTDAIDNDFTGSKHDECETTEEGSRPHHNAQRPCAGISQDHPQCRHWKDLRTLVVVTTCNIQEAKETWETRWYVSSHAPRAKALARAVRKHWSIGTVSIGYWT